MRCVIESGPSSLYTSASVRLKNLSNKSRKSLGQSASTSKRTALPRLERVTGIDSQRRQHRENFFLKVLVRPGRAFRAQFGHLGNTDAIFREQRKQFFVPE